MSPIIVLTIFVQIIYLTRGALEPTKFQHGKVYALENQQAGKYLTVGVNGQYTRTGDHGTPSLDQKWRFIMGRDPKTGGNGWQLVPLNGQPPQGTIWNEVYLEHGKFQFKSISSRQCLEASSRGIEVPCVTEDLFQRWYPYLQKD